MQRTILGDESLRKAGQKQIPIDIVTEQRPPVVAVPNHIDGTRNLRRTDLDYVNCSPYRVPIARRAAAHEALSAGGVASMA